MTREVISIHVGQAGVQIGSACWELYCLEHGILPDGKVTAEVENDHLSRTFFHETKNGNFVPRAIFVDLEPSVIDAVRNGLFRGLFPADQMMNAKEDAASNYARGYYTIGKEIIEDVLNCVRRESEKCDHLQGYIYTHSYGGGTGSGFFALLLEQIRATEGQKANQMEMGVFPSPLTASSIVEPYNTVLAVADALEHIDLSFLFDNEAVFRICRGKLGVQRPSFINMNRLIAQIVSSITALRFEGSLNVDMKDLHTNLVPFPRIHFPVASYAPFLPPDVVTNERLTSGDLLQSTFEEDNQMLSVDPNDGLYMAVTAIFRGDITPSDVNKAICRIKSERKLDFVDWCPTGFKVGINYQPSTVIPGGDLSPSTRSVTSLSNTTAIKHVWETLLKKYDLMYRKRAFVHW